MVVIYRFTFQGVQFTHPSIIGKPIHYIGYTLKQAEQQYRKDFGLRYKHINFRKAY